MEKLIKIGSLLLLSSVKFIGAVPLAYTYRLGYVETILWTVCGGMLGVFVFTYYTDKLVWLWRKFVKRGAAKKKIFTRWNRFLVWLRIQHGLEGIAVLTPVLLSIPVGTFIAVRLIRDKKKVMWYMFISILAWSFLISSLFELYKVSSLEELQKIVIE